ncbi:glucose 1-dehydrogenase [Sphingobium sp. Sx8-8]|uniref:SDR family NAD(P)-dependent oxidoreductase n=1 Tax=Sphingobium sp. Sx8-8 TaxID=2933617 RepID=UPI001F580D5B|nr:glucose 1-dehydrogenase [Sphingobium sp. Sx8-8]
MKKFKGKSALIIGAGTGIGAQTARLLASQGASVAVGDLAADAAQAVVDEILSVGGKAIALSLDVSQESDVSAAVTETVETFGRLDILHNNAAITSRDVLDQDTDVLNMDVDLWDRTMAVNLRGPMLAAKHALPQMIAQGSGSIINTASGKGIQGDLDRTAYGTSKGGLITLTRYLATQYGKSGIRANALIVGLVVSEALRAAFPADRLAFFESHHLTPQLGTPMDVAQAVAFLASDEASFITGHALAVDGGFTAHSPVFAGISAA